MNTAQASENGPYPTNHTRPFFYSQPTAQQPFPNPWYLGQVYNPYCLPAPGFRSGNPYFPFYSVALPEYPGFYLPQPQVHARMNRRPSFSPHPPPPPMFYHATRFRHFSSQGKRMETKETQTDLRPQENIPKRNGNVGTHTKDCDVANASRLSSGVGTMNGTISDNLESSRMSVTAVQERDFHKNACTSASYRNMLPSSYAFEKEEVRIEYGGSSPAAIQLWKSYKETIPLYDVATEKEMADNVVQHDMYSVSSCDGGQYGPRAEGEELVPQSAPLTKEDSRGSHLPMRGICAVQEQDTACKPDQNSAVGSEPEKLIKADKVDVIGLGTECQTQSSNVQEFYNSSRAFPVPKSNVVSKNLVSNGLCNEEESDHGGHDGLVEKEVEIKELNLVNAGETVTCDGELALWAEDAVDGYVNSPSWLDCLDSLQNDSSYDIHLARRKPKRTSVLSITSDDLSSRDEGSSMDNTPTTYFVPDYLLKKSVYSLQKSTDGSDKEKIKSGGSLNEDEDCVQRRKTSVVGTQYDASQFKGSLEQKEIISSKGRKLSVPVRDVSRRKLYSLKKKPRKNMSLSEPEDSEEYWVIEESAENGREDDDEEDDDEDAEYVIQKSVPQGQLTISNGKLYKQASKQRVLWKAGKGSAPSQLIRWPSCEVKIKKKGHENSEVRRPKQKIQEAECENGSYVKMCINKLDQCLNEVSEQRRPARKSLSGKSQKGNVGLPNEDYWSGRGAKPKLSEHDCQPPVKCSDQEKPQRRKGSFKLLSKSKTPLPEPEEVEVWLSPKSLGSRGSGARKTFYRR